MVRIAGFHPADPGSSPGVGTPFFFIVNLISFIMITKLILIILSLVCLLCRRNSRRPVGWIVLSAEGSGVCVLLNGEICVKIVTIQTK